MFDHIQSQTYHARRGPVKNAFRYGVDFVLTDFDGPTPALLSHNRANLWSIFDRHHGGPRGAGIGPAWFRQQLQQRGFPMEGSQLLLLTQPSLLGLHFNPVSFWIALRDGLPCAFIAEVNNTFGDRHCYFCAHPDFRPIAPRDRLQAQKLMHVSPFQDVAGCYQFNFQLTEDLLNIRISYENGREGVLASLSGLRQPASNRSLIWAAFRRPLGAARVLGLIHWQALKLWLKRARFRTKPQPPDPLVSDAQPPREVAQ